MRALKTLTSNRTQARLASYYTIFLACLWLAIAPALAVSDGYQYAGLEFFGSSQMTRSEIEKVIRLRTGASLERVEKARVKLEKRIHDKRRLFANIQLVSAPPDRVFLVVDFIERRHDSIPTRKLVNPHNVILKSTKPSMLLDKLEMRLASLEARGRPWRESYPGGVRTFTDEPANQLATEIRRFGPAMRDNLLEVTRSDPDPDRRVEAITLLNWAGSYDDTCRRLLRCIDDSDYRVRAAAVRFIFPRFDELPYRFPFNELLECSLRQVKRPSHNDRVKSLYMIAKVLRKMPILTARAKELSEPLVDKFAKNSCIPSLRDISERLKTIYAQPLPVKRTRWSDIPDTGF